MRGLYQIFPIFKHDGIDMCFQDNFWCLNVFTPKLYELNVCYFVVVSGY